ncbi:hypothetical protein [Nocardioides sp.]|uniref:hypothetical protein n=1 Tax=Nocardioides sp. TaxID=35761 RepID=UPI003511EBA9
MSAESVPPAPASQYRLAPVLATRLVGSALVALALVVFLLTALSFALDWPRDPILVVVGLGLAAVFGLGGWLRGPASVVRLDDAGYRVRLIRGAGVKQGAWSEVSEASAQTRHGLRVVVLERHDGRETVIPVDALAADREHFADAVRARLRAAHG